MSKNNKISNGVKKSQKQITGLMVVTLLVAGVLLPALSVQAANIIEQMSGAIKKFDLPAGGEDAEETALGIAGNIINFFLSVFGIVFLSLMIYGGYKWMMASGREEELKKAKDIVRSAIIGLIIVMMAFAITYFVSQALTTATTAP
ncbi:hypothetical protein HYZ76_01350 [Candidatus Falkowbacteria bacterium]|nr:hypothetical protein [Candidatus Falkowbacteria bacterium]